MQTILASYAGSGATFDASYEVVFHLLLLRWNLRILIVAHDRRDTRGVEHFRAELDRALRFFS